MNNVSLIRAVTVLSLCLHLPALAQPINLHLLGRSYVDRYQLNPNIRDVEWLKGKKALVLGTSAPDYAPFDISTGSDYYEGISADYAGLLGQLLDIAINVNRYSTRAEAIDALKKGEIDLLATANAYEQSEPHLIFSTSYAVDTALLVKRLDKPKATGDETVRLAMVYHYQPVERVKKSYPKMELQLYESTLGALSAVTFGQADVYLGDVISTHNLINKNYLNTVYLKELATMDSQGFRFAVRHDNPDLVRLINAALAVIPPSESNAILSRWGVSVMPDAREQPLEFTAAEQQWIEQNPRLKVAITDDFLPFTFFDKHGEFNGLAADLLQRISLSTGLKFEVISAHSVSAMVDSVKEGEADLIAAFTPSSRRLNDLRFTKPYLSTPYVLITRMQSQGSITLEQFKGKRIAVIPDSSLATYLAEQHPDINIVPAANSIDALTLLTQGKVEGAINALISARYLIKQQYADQLQISSNIGKSPAQFSLAMDKNARTLYSILSKSLARISPEDMDDMTHRWRSAVVLDSQLSKAHYASILKLALTAGGVLLIFFFWIAYLRRLIRTRTQAERALGDQLAFMRALIEGTPHPIYVRDREGRLLICNEGYLKTVGLCREALMGKTLLELPFNPAQQHTHFHADYQRVMEEDRPLVRDHRLILIDGSELTIYHWVLPYRTSNESVVGIIGGWMDVSDRQQLLLQLQEAKNQADQANVAKSDFLTTMSHEIRTPVNAIIGMLELAMKKAEHGVCDSDSIGVASHAALGLLDLIGDILDIAHIESGQMSLNQQRTHLLTLVESSARVYEAMAQQKGLLMSFELDPRINIDVLIDPLRFRQILSNLLSNALKFTDRGRVHMTVRAKATEHSERLRVCVQVEDSGIGISSEDQKRLFKPFSQINSAHKQPGSSGLGLMICQQLCELMGGSLALTSTLGKETQVRLDLDIVTVLSKASIPVAIKPSQHIRPLKILVVDDYPPNRRLLAQQLEYLGHSAIEAEDGAQGLKAWRVQRFDLIMTDCAMPVMDGYELAQSIRAEEAAHGLSPVLIVGFTANAQSGETGRCVAAGMNDCLFKPISLHNLEARLASADLSPINVDMDVPGTVTHKLIDLCGLESLTNGDADALKHLLEPLISSLEDDMAALLKAFTKHDLPGLGDVAHRVKSGARMVKATPLALCCENLEEACVSSEWTQLAQRVDELYEAMAQVLEVIEVYRV